MIKTVYRTLIFRLITRLIRKYYPRSISDITDCDGNTIACRWAWDPAFEKRPLKEEIRRNGAPKGALIRHNLNDRKEKGYGLCSKNG